MTRVEKYKDVTVGYDYLTENQRDLIALEIVKQNMANMVIGDNVTYNEYLTDMIVRFKIARKDVEEADNE